MIFTQVYVSAYEHSIIQQVMMGYYTVKNTISVLKELTIQLKILSLFLRPWQFHQKYVSTSAITNV